MASIIKNRLKELCDADPSLNTLWAQWTFDEQLISKALNNVSQTFPHYSLHDASHSNQIVTNIERILGAENINSLSATDLWLILEAAFCHDIGMVIPMNKIREDWDTPEFNDYLLLIATDEAHELHLVGKKYKDSNCEKIFNHSQWPLDTFEDIRILLADFYRKKHAPRAEAIVKNPWLEIGLSSPRNELLPTRLFKVLGAVSAHHGYSFDDVKLLPKKEVGFGNDNAHPRYIACLLRLGDLLDLDDNRFCPVMLKTAGTLPSSTHAHIEKHMSIEHFRMDQNRIEVRAICETYEGYAATASWFAYLEQEINQQMMHWDDIVPSKKMGLLPTIGYLDIQLKDYELLSRDRPPKFEVDEDKMFDLLQGAGLYEKPFQCIREILQNAADSTLLKLWIDKDILGKYNNISFSEPSNEINEILKNNYKIDINIERGNSNEKTIGWNIKIQDKGMGIDKSGLTYLQKIGSSNKDLKKRKLINSMPLWLQPSGAFGIGFQSIYLITDSVTILSKNFYNGDAITVKMDDPNKSKLGNIFIKKEMESYKFEVGTLINFNIENDKVPSHFSYSLSDRIITSEIQSYDFIEEKPLNIEILNLISEVKRFSKNSYIPVSLIFDGDPITLDHIEFNNMGFYHSSGLRIVLTSPENSNIFVNGKYESQLFFKGQPLETTLSSHFCHFSIDILGLKASDILEINRNKIKKDKESEINSMINHALIDFMKKLERDSKFSNDDIQFMNAFIITCHEPAYFNTEDFKYNTLPSLVIQDNITTTDIITSSECHLTIRTHERARERTETIITSNNDKYHITVDVTHSNQIIKFLCKYLLPKHFEGVEIDFEHKENIREVKIKYTHTKTCIINNSVIKEVLRIGINNLNRWPRMSMICPNEFDKLAVKDNKIGFCEGLHHHILYQVYYPELNCMILPFKSGDDSFAHYNFDHLVAWVYKNRKKPETTKEEIISEYERFTTYIKNIMNT
ncbi:HD domain-containing protein [Moritella dasanensis]|uniref:HD domain-containing protein n=1 Tax=Moritella dasanensis TaxID=428031 RepID=UPI00031E0058|nr:hypothetical protein [Moritella dasanensis]